MNKTQAERIISQYRWKQYQLIILYIYFMWWNGGLITLKQKGHLVCLSGPHTYTNIYVSLVIAKVTDVCASVRGGDMSQSGKQHHQIRTPQHYYSHKAGEIIQLVNKVK